MKDKTTDATNSTNKNSRFIIKITLCLLLSLSTTSFAAIIIVNATDGAVADDGLCSISEAILAANTDAVVSLATGECTAGEGSDSIILSKNITLTTEYENNATFGRTGTPVISSTLVLDGQGYTLQRDASLTCDLTNNLSEIGEFRILRITGSLTLQNINIAQGCADGNGGSPQNGGGILNRGVLSLEQATIHDNKAGYAGGGLWHGQGTISSISKSLFVNNLADNIGGGLYSQGPITLIENSTFSGNSASGSGGGIFNEASLNRINNSTFSGNLARFGGGYSNGFFGSETNITNSLFHNNDGINECDIGFTVINGSNNISDNSTGGCPGLISPALTTSSVSNTLADNGGPTMTHALLVGSQAIDTGNVNSTEVDQRGISAFGTRDLGAYEFRPFEDCPVALHIDGFTTTVMDADELNESIECANLNGEANGGDTIELGADITLTQEYENDALYGRTGTAPINSKLILDGKGFILQRDATTVNLFRLLRTTTDADVQITNIELVNGKVTDAGTTGTGGALFNQAKLQLTNSIIRQNFALSGGGLNHSGTNHTIISNNLFKQNVATFDGSNISIRNGLIDTIENTTFTESGNNASLYVSNGNIYTINNATFSTIGGVSIYLNDGVINSINNSSFIGSTTAIQGFDDTTFVFGRVTNLNNNIFKNSSVCFEVNITNSNNNLADAMITCEGTTVGNAGIATNVSATLSDNFCVTSLADGSCVPTHALMTGSNAIDNSVSGTITDQRGFTPTGIRDIGSFETFVPIVVAPSDITSEATGLLSSPPLGLANVTDQDEIGLIAIPTPTNNFALGLTTVTWSATDSQGFVGTDTQVVTIVDTTAPIVTAPMDIITEATGTLTPVNLGAASATDVVDGTLTPISNTLGPFAVGLHTITWSATDNVGNLGSDTQMVNIQALIGGNLNGLNGTLVLQNMGGDNLTLTANGIFRFDTAVDNLSNYAVTVFTQPATQYCEVTNASGQINAASIDDIVITCTENTISLDSLSIDFGMVFVSENSTQNIIITNTGSGDIIIDSNSLPTSPFSIVGGSCAQSPITLTSGQTCDYIIEFSPPRDGSFTDSFDIFSNTAASPTTVNLTGISTIRIIPTLSIFGLLLMIALFINCVYFRKNTL